MPKSHPSHATCDRPAWARCLTCLYRTTRHALHALHWQLSTESYIQSISQVINQCCICSCSNEGTHAPTSLSQPTLETEACARPTRTIVCSLLPSTSCCTATAAQAGPALPCLYRLGGPLSWLQECLPATTNVPCGSKCGIKARKAEHHDKAVPGSHQAAALIAWL
jgi:hypothetical protein